MKLSELINFYPIDCSEALEYAASDLRDAAHLPSSCSIKQILSEIEELFFEHHENVRFTEYIKEDTKKNGYTTYYLFDTGYKYGGTSERIIGYTIKNIGRSTCPYYGLFFKRESLMRNELANGIHIADIYFGDFRAMNMFLDNLAEKAVTEDWKFQGFKSMVSQPILKNYLEHSFYQANVEGKILHNDVEQKACMNTGLIDSMFNDLYIVCDIEQELLPNILFAKRYTNPKITTRNNRLFNNTFTEPPIPATFYKDMKELLFDCEAADAKGGINLNDSHIFEDNLDRINDSLPEPRRYDKNNIIDCQGEFESALSRSLALAKRNYKLVAPQFWPETGKIQFLMPIYLTKSCEITQEGAKTVVLPNVALCLERDKNGRYLGTSILTLDMAYQNARLIAKPDTFWLDPHRIKSSITDSSLEVGVTEKFEYSRSHINLKNNNIVGLIGTVGAGENAMLHISNLCNRVVTQNEMRQLEAVCKTKAISVKLIKKSDKGWEVSLKDVNPDFEQLLSEMSIEQQIE